MKTIKTAVIGHEALHRIPGELNQLILKQFGEPGKRLELTVYIEVEYLAPAHLANPYITVSADLERNDMAVMTGFLPTLLLAQEDKALQDITRGAHWGKDEVGPYPLMLRADEDGVKLQGLMWSEHLGAEAADLAGLPMEVMDQLRPLPPEERLAKARELAPAVQTAWQHLLNQADSAGITL